MFAFFGLGFPELIVLAVIGLGVVAIVVFSSRQRTPPKHPSRDIDELWAEVDRLRDDVERLKRASKTTGPADGIASGEPSGS